MRRRGFTLLEIMVALAIVGVMASLSAYGLSQAVHVGRANAAADLFVSITREARVRAVSEQCTQFVQFNGPTYAVSAPQPGWPTGKSAAYIVRKGNCDSTTMTFEQPGAPYDDAVVDTTFFSEQLVDVAVTAGVVPGDVLTNSGLIIGYNKAGQRFIASGTGGTFADVLSLGANPLDLTVSPHDPSVQRVVIIPAANGASLN